MEHEHSPHIWLGIGAGFSAVPPGPDLTQLSSLPHRNILLGTHLAWRGRYIWLVRRFMMTFPQMPVSFRCASIPFQTRQPTCQPSTRQPALCEKQPIGTRQGSRPPARAGARGTCRARCRRSARWANARPAGARWLRQRRAEPGILSFIFFEWDWMDGWIGWAEREAMICNSILLEMV